MIEGLKKAKDILKKYNQEYLLSFYDELNEDQQKFLINQIFSIDFEQIFNLYEASKKDEVIPNNSIEPLPYVDKSKLSRYEKEYYIKLGKTVISSNQFATVTMAGGQRN